MKNKLERTSFDILQEALCTITIQFDKDEDEYDDEFSSDEDKLEDYLDDIDDYEDDDNDSFEPDEIEYTAEMVTVFETRSGRYIVEMTNLAPYAIRNNLAIDEAFNNVCRVNNINNRNTILLIESKDNITNAYKECKKDCKACNDPELKKKKKGLLNTSIQNISFLASVCKNKGIQVCKKC